jgi:hypothetical protein
MNTLKDKGERKVIKYIDSSLINDQTDEVAKPQIIIACGFVVAETDEYITLSREIIDEEFRGQVAIPKVAIII